jgi:hypothetical protein
MKKVKQNVKQISGKEWRERIGVEPTVDTAGCLPTDLKSAESTGAHPLPAFIQALPGLQSAKCAASIAGYLNQQGVRKVEEHWQLPSSFEAAFCHVFHGLSSSKPERYCSNHIDVLLNY